MTSPAGTSGRLARLDTVTQTTSVRAAVSRRASRPEVPAGRLARLDTVTQTTSVRAASPAKSATSRRPRVRGGSLGGTRSEEHTSELQSRLHLVCRLLLEKKKKKERDRTRRKSTRHSAGRSL